MSGTHFFIYWYVYEGGMGLDQLGPIAKPSKIGRVLDDGTSQITRFEYNSRGAITRHTDPVGRETVYEYDANGIDLLRLKKKNGSNYELLQEMTYNTSHEPLTAKDVAGQTVTYTYNANGMLATVVTPARGGLSAADRTTTYSYFPDNAPAGAGRIQTITLPLTATMSYTYDGYGRLRTITDPEGNTITRDYDALDRLTKITHADGTFSETVYSRLDPEKRRDRVGRWTHAFYDALGRVVSMRDPLGRTTTQTWCTCGSLDKLTDANGNTTTWERDLQGRVTKETRPNGTQWQYTYENALGRTKQITDPKGQSRNYTYYLDNALKEIAYTNAVYSTPNVAFTYDAAYARAATMTDGTGTTTFAYHAIGNPPSVGAGQLATVDGPGTSDTITYGYDEMGRRVSRTIDGMTTSVGFDALDRVAMVAHSAGTFTYGYLGTTGRVANLMYPNGTSVTYGYHPAPTDRGLAEIHHKFSGGGTLAKFSYIYDDVGNIKAWQQQDEANPPNAYDLEYDAVDRLTSAVYRTTDSTPTILKRYRYSYDLANNRTTTQIDDAPFEASYNNMNRLQGEQPAGALNFSGSTNEAATVTVQSKPAVTTSDNKFSGAAQVGSGTNTVTVTATDPANNVRTSSYQVTIGGASKSYAYDANGNLTQKVDGDTWGYEWYADDRLARVTKNGVEQARFIYDGIRRRYQKIAGGVTITYTHDEDDVLREEWSSGAVYRYVHGGDEDEPLARRDQGGSTVFYHADHLGSVVKVTNGAGTTTMTRRYDPYGNLESGAADPGYAFTGREWDPEIGLYYFRSRYYDAKAGRFTGEDKIGLAGGLNLYAYVEANPLSWRDPFGLAPGDKYPTRNEAAKRGCRDIFHPTRRERVEYCGNICKSGDGYTYDPPTTDNRPRECTTPPTCNDGSPSIGIYHSHPDNGYPSADRMCSTGDHMTAGYVKVLGGTGQPVWLVDPEGCFRKCMPSGRTQELGCYNPWLPPKRPDPGVPPKSPTPRKTPSKR